MLNGLEADERNVSSFFDRNALVTILPRLHVHWSYLRFLLCIVFGHKVYEGLFDWSMLQRNLGYGISVRF